MPGRKDVTATSPQYLRLRMMVIDNLNACVRQVEYEQWDELIRLACAIIQDSATLLLMGEEA